jgi:tRNA-specific 2-thiouridylase
MRIVVAMSGGVDSSVAAALLAQAGHEVIGISMHLYDRSGGSASFGRCCTLDDLQDARRVATVLNIPHYILNFERQFEDQVVSNFVREYAAGRTPLPCAHCNSDLKFATLLDRAKGFGADVVATGHYARVEPDGTGRYLLKRSLDARKDQSYFLFSLTQAQLARAAFPLGALTKDVVRDQARALGLPVADKPDSQEICFVPDGDYAAFLEERAPDVRHTGAIVNIEGQVVGRHDGVHRFTVGQRKGLGVASPIPLYVLKLNATDQTVTVGPRAALGRRSLTASGVNWVSGIPPATPSPIAAQIRHRHQASPATVSSLDGARASVEFDEPQPAITPGQAVVFYQGDCVLGGGWID